MILLALSVSGWSGDALFQSDRYTEPVREPLTILPRLQCGRSTAVERNRINYTANSIIKRENKAILMHHSVGCLSSEFKAFFWYKLSRVLRVTNESIFRF